MNTNYLFYFCDGIGSVFDSQVLGVLEEIKLRNTFKKIYLFLGVRNEAQKTEFLSRKFIPEINIIFYRSYPNYPVFNYLNSKSINKSVNSLNININEVIFHTRGEMTARHLSKVLPQKYHNKIIPDIRGANVEEIEEFSGLNKISRILKIINNKRAVRSLKIFRKISVVSDSLKEYLINNHMIDSSSIVTTPCLSGSFFRFDRSDRERIRRDLNLSNEDLLIVFSSGGTAKWQNNNALTLIADKGLKVLNLSKVKIEHKNVINKFVSYQDIPAYLSASDAAIIWRDKSIVNKVASPVKFSEYVCCGLPVIANDSVDMIKEYISKNSCGILLTDLNDVDMNILKELRQKDRLSIAESGRSSFGIDEIVQKYINIYSEISNS